MSHRKGLIDNMDFKTITLEDKDEIDKYCRLRPIRSCEYNFTILYMWQHYYDVKYHTNEHYLLFMEELEGHVYSMMPLCKEEHFEEAFLALWQHFKSLELPLRIYVADEQFANFVQSYAPDQFDVFEERDSFDYIYDAEALRMMTGKSLRKKRNHLNAFHETYGDRYVFKTITADSEFEFTQFIKSWSEQKGEEERMVEEELTGLCRVLEHLDVLDVKIGTIYVDGELKAFSMGSEILEGEMAIIHAEKADVDIRGLYQAINQEFLIHGFPNAKYVNREDDVGVEGLRKAKLSYHPIELLKKYTIFEKQVNNNDELAESR